ncbi:hypothetical protein BX666DRAFT_1126169 [Dichotomocladium elegans]|nr:hypothetical protein BX666DRAFT_1126169 [Dichotomocladium elegans]
MLAMSKINTTATKTQSDPKSVKRKQSSLEKLPESSPSSIQLSSAAIKRVRADSTESKSSSWFQRLYTTSSMYSLSESENKEEDREENDTMAKDQTNDGKVTEPKVTADSESAHRGQNGNGKREGDSGSTHNGSSSNGYYSQSGLWTWLGYSPAASAPKQSDGSATTATATTDAGAAEQQSLDADPELETKKITKKSSTSARQASNRTEKLPQVSRTKTAEGNRSDTNGPTPTPTSGPSELTTKEESLNREPRPSNSTSWRSFFWASSDQRDSVIVEKNANDAQLQEQVSKSSSPTRSTSFTRKNMVLPPIHNDKPAPAQTSDQDLHQGLLTKALRAINTMFLHTSPSPRVNRRFVKFVEAMKADPENVANKKFVIIGVHGWFPMKLVRNVIGEPTGTSLKFCEQMAQGLKMYFSETHDLSIPSKAITTIPLEGEGKVGERVDMLYENLKSNPAWMSALAAADVIFWATHSQGTPVSAILLHRLMEEMLVRVPEQPVCFLAMAGISHGPFPSLKGNLLVKYFEADAARELFEFMDPSSAITQRYRQSMACLLRNDIKTVLIGSMQDQVVPLYSAIMAGASHPNILRAIYIDGHVYSEDDFLINLIIFALKLRNSGLSDHGLLTHLSEVLAGDLYSWEGGHSTVYEEIEVFKLAVQHLFESAHSRSTIGNSNDAALLGPFEAKVRLNPFYLPWAMRGICDDTLVLGNKTFSRELDNLRDLFERWKPASAKLREIKFRLEPLKARL